MITFSVPGRPQATARPRVLKTGHTYMPRETVAAQRRIGEAALAIAWGKKPLFPTACVSVTIEACFCWPKRTPKKRILPGWTPMPNKPDVENLAKTVLDGCNGILWTDDNQVTELVIRKWRVENPEDEGFHVEVKEQP